MPSSASRISDVKLARASLTRRTSVSTCGVVQSVVVVVVGGGDLLVTVGQSWQSFGIGRSRSFHRAGRGITNQRAGAAKDRCAENQRPSPAVFHVSCTSAGERERERG
jgi:hypothetical protein